MKIDPSQYLTDDEKYLYALWEPEIGHKVMYDGTVFTIKEIIEDQISLNELEDKLLWIQDVAWKPTLEDCDVLIRGYSANVVSGSQIHYRKDNKNCYFERPNTLAEYRDIIRQLRVLNKFKVVR